MALKQAFSTTEGLTDLLYVATHLNLCCSPIPEVFIPEDVGVSAPAEPMSLDAAFGEGSFYEFSALYVRYYNKDSNIWTDGDSGMVNAEVKADVALQVSALAIYQELLKEYEKVYGVQRDVQWRKYVAEKLIEVCAG